MTDSPQQILDKKASAKNGEFTELFPTLRPIRSKEEHEALVKEAADDDHRVICPSHIIHQNGQIAGYVGLNSLPVWQGWFHTKRIKGRDSMILFSQCDNFFRMQGVRVAGFFVQKNSPFYDLCGHMGYEQLDEGKLMVKAL